MKLSKNSLLLHTGFDFDHRTGAVSIPISQASTFKQRAPGENAGYEYARTNNPTREALERIAAVLEGGARGMAFCSGLAAITTVLALFSAGDHLVVTDDLYGGTYRILSQVFARFGLVIDFVDTADLQAVAAAIGPKTKAVYVETPTNPLMKITDIAAVASIAHQHGAMLIVDNTFMSPYLQLPLELGADIVVHSATKYLGGHSDVVLGLAVTKSAELGERLAYLQNALGAVPGPNDAWLVMRGIKTLGVRMERAQANAMKIATWLKGHPQVSRVYYPGLMDHPGHEIARRQGSGFGAMLSFDVKCPEFADVVVRNVELITLAESLGAVESLLCVPAKMTHASIPAPRRATLGITDSLLRLSVGIEDPDDLIADLEAAFAKASC